MYIYIYIYVYVYIYIYNLKHGYRVHAAPNLPSNIIPTEIA